MSTSPSPARLAYGAWPSPISPADLAGATVGLDEIRVDDGRATWLELRPTEGGRSVLVGESDDGPVDLLPPGWDVRTRAHEYGGGSYLCRGGVTWAASGADDRWYRVEPGAEPVPVTPEPDRPRAERYADPDLSADAATLVLVRESHAPDGGVTHDLVAVPADGSGPPRRLLGGTDFVASPRLSADGRRLVAVTWDHPDMPWDATRLVVVDLDDQGEPVGEPRGVDGGPGVSVVAPAFGAGGRLHAVAEVGDLWHVVAYDEPAEAGEDWARTDLTPGAGEVGGPQWQFGLRPFGWTDDGRLVVVESSGGVMSLAVRETDGGLRRLDLPFRAVRGASVVLDGARALVGGAGPSELLQVAAVDVATGAVTTLARSGDAPPSEVVPAARVVTFPTAGGRDAHAVHYAPRNGELTGLDGEAPPLVVMSHGGPTAQALPVLSTAVAFWTSRGFAVVDVNYGGSSGFGREYRDRLRGRWGFVDVQDCVAAAAWLAEQGLADPARTVIRGGSAGGYTTLRALTTTDAFAAGTSLFGVADLRALARDTHSFESRYLDGLVAPWPQEEDEYVRRSPLSHLDGLSCPVLVLQGLEDAVVPPAQAEAIVEAVAEKGLPHAYVAFEGEQHGFRLAASVRAAAEAELSFYGQVLGFEPAGDVPRLELSGGA